MLECPGEKYLSFLHSSSIAPTFTAAVLCHKLESSLPTPGSATSLLRCMTGATARAAVPPSSPTRSQSSPRPRGVPPNRSLIPRTAAAPGSSRLPCPLGWTRYLWSSRCCPRIPMSPVRESRSNRGCLDPNRPLQPNPGAVRPGRSSWPPSSPEVPRCHGGGLLSLSIADLEKCERVGSRGPKPQKNPESHVAGILLV